MKRYIIIALIIIGALGIEAYEWYAISQINTPDVSYKELQTDIDLLTEKNASLISENKKLKTMSEENTKLIKELQEQSAIVSAKLNVIEQGEIELLIDKLKDRDYTGTYNEEYTWYTAAEALGTIGKPAIPYLIKKIDTEDEYERSLVFYALLLASQADNVKEFAGDDYIKITDSFNPEAQEEMKQEVLKWWEKYKDKF
ncbi:MAG: hypothetical protein K0S71_2639 [Clostridia bacterium]|jgi:hypothetical protein|nr:hypothetical protein [Clostridia bacterium]